MSTEGGGGTFGGWADVTRTRDVLVNRVKVRLQELRVAQDKLAYNEGGLNSVRLAIDGELLNLVNKEALSSYTISIPKVGNISDSDKKDRKLPDIVIEAVLAGDIHSFTVGLNLTV